MNAVRRWWRAIPQLRPRQKTLAQGISLGLLAGTLVVLAVRYEGAPIHEVDLNDGGVWVTNGSEGMMARLNSQSDELELGILTSASSRHVFQEASDVAVFDDGGGNPVRSIARADVVTGTAVPVSLPGSFKAAAGRGAVVIFDDATGRVWVKGSDQLEGFTPTSPHTAQVSERSAVTVTRGGTALVTDRQKGIVRSWRLDTAGQPVEGEVTDFDTEFTDAAVLSAVGEVPVVLQEGQLLRPGSDPVRIEGDQPVLQQPGPADENVLISTSAALWSTPISGGSPRRISDLDVSGSPSAPVLVAGCAHAAWNAPGRDNYVRMCRGSSPFVGEIAPLDSTSELVFRVNRAVVVLNDIVNGSAWMVQQDGLTLVDNWDSVNPNAKDPQVAEANEDQRNDRRNQPPTAVDDKIFGARPGSTVILPVTLNDVDPDGDIIALTKPPTSTPDAAFSLVGDGTQVQAKVAQGASGTIEFEYEITDGRGQHTPTTGQVFLAIHSEADKGPKPLPNQTTTLKVASGATASVNVLSTWYDPEGDPLILQSASSDGGEVGIRPDGTIDFSDDGAGTGIEIVEFVVKGGDATSTGTLEVTVVDPRRATPTAVPDHFSGLVGSTILLDPLRNDTDAAGGQLSLPEMSVIEGGAAQVTRDNVRGTATFRTTRHGTYYLRYVAGSANGRVSEPTLVRVDVTPVSGENHAPIATRDIAAVRPAGTALVDVLANDSDPDGDVMVVQGVEVPPAYADVIKVSLIAKRFVRVEAIRPFVGRQPSFEYLLSDGRSDQVRGSVSVTQSVDSENRRPVALEDQVTARAGSIINVPVLENDSDADGDKLTVRQQDLFDIGDRPVLRGGNVPVVATGSSIRVLVPDDGTTQLQIGYGVRDSRQARADARLVLNIKPDDPADNQAPQPRPIEDRTVSGQKIRVQVDEFGADPDGDPVVYGGLAEPPKFGRIAQVGTSWFDYEPFEGDRNTGTDAFKIVLTDRYGASGIADVRIGVAPRSAENQAPAALDDSITIKPGLTIQYPVLDNDSDPDGDPLLLVPESFSAARGTDARLVDTSIEVNAPSLGDRNQVEQVARYSVTDGLGATSGALLTVTVREDAPDHAPIALDDTVDLAALEGKEAGDDVTVDVLDNDGDPDGSRDDLELELVQGNPGRVEDRKLEIPLKRTGQVVPYRITDRTGQFSFAFVYVAGTDNLPPQLDEQKVPVEVKAGVVEELDLNELVVVRSGRTPKVSRTDRITSSNGDTKGSGSKLTFKAPAAYYGPASITLTVIDGADNNDPEGLEAQITIPITVLPAENVAPKVRSATVLVDAGGEPVRVDLSRLATDPNRGDKLTYLVSGQDRGVSAEIDGDVLRISAAEDARSTSVDLRVTANDGKAEAVPGRVTVVVVGTENAAALAPAMALRDLRVEDGVQGKVSTVDLADAIVFDPFPDRSKSISSVTSTDPGVSPSVEGTRMRIRPARDGELVISYVMGDGSGKAERDVRGRVVLVAAREPDAPGKPTAVEGGPDSVQLTWRAPYDGGRQIQQYNVSWNGGGKKVCTAAQCVIEDLDPGKAYTFQVAAENEIGPGPASPKSDPVTPDTVPQTMAAPTIAQEFTDRNGQLTLSWAPPENSGSDITGYELRSYPETTLKKVGPGETTLTWTGLGNGTDYRFTVLARNDRGPGPESVQSAPEKPFTTPITMPAPVLEAEAPDGDGQGYLTVSWARLVSPDDGWDEVSSYQVQVFRDGEPHTTKSSPGTTQSQTFDVENGHAYTAQVWATNRAGDSERSERSSSDVAWDRSSAPSGISKADDCPQNACQANTGSYLGRVSFTTPADNGGYPVVAYTYRTSDGRTGRLEDLSTTAEGAPATGLVRFSSAQANQSVALTPITNVPGEGEQSGDERSGGDFDPFAKPFAPSGSSSSLYRKVGFSWSGGNGNGRSVAGTQIDGDASGQFGAGGSTEVGTAQGGESRCVRVRSRTADGGWSDWSGSICGSAQARAIQVYFTNTAPRSPCNANCQNINFRMIGFRSSTTYNFTSNIVSSVNGTRVSGSVGTDGDGRADRTAAVYNTAVYDAELYCITVDGVQGCERGN